MTRSLEELREAGRDPVRDSDVKRKMLELDGGFDEAELGFSKFSKFLSQAEDHDVVRLLKTEAGNYEVTLPGGDASRRERTREPEPRREPAAPEEREPSAKEPSSEEAVVVETEAATAGEPALIEIDPDEVSDVGRRLGPRRGSTRRRYEDDAPSLFEGQVVSSPHHDEPDQETVGAAAAPVGTSAGNSGPFDAGELGLPTDPDAIARYLTHRYRGVGEKTAESLVERFGTDLFRVLRDDPDAIKAAVTPKRAEQVLEAWHTDYERRLGRRSGGGDGGGGGDNSRSERGGRRGGRRRGPRGRNES